MHIVIDAHLAVKQIDGVSRYLQGLLSELPKVDSGVDYSILTRPYSKSCLTEDLFTHPNVERIEVSLNGPTPRQHVFVPRLLSRLKPDLYHHPQYDLPIGISMPSVVTIHDLKYIFQPELLRRKSHFKSFYIKQSLRHSLRRANGIIAVSQNTLADLEKFANLDDKTTTVIGHGVEFKPENRTSSKSSLPGLPEQYILFVGTRRPHKNIDGLIRALHILHEQGVDISLIVCGKAYADYDRPERLTAALKLSEHVKFLDFVPDEQLQTLYRSAQVVALPSFYEGFGIPLIEGMAHSKPVLGSQLSSMPDVIGDAGLTVDPYDPVDIADKLERLLTNRQLYNELASKARKRAHNFSWSSVAKETFNFYIKTLQNS